MLSNVRMRKVQDLEYYLLQFTDLLKIAAEKLDRLLADSGITEDELVEEFRRLRRGHER
jgi:hypothetical protein